MNRLGEKVEIVPQAKDHQHLKIVLNSDGTLEKVQIYHDGSGATYEIVSVYEELKEEIAKFGNRTSKLVANYQAEEKRKKKSWRKI